MKIYLLFVLFFSVTITFAQNKIVVGKVKVDDEKQKSFVIEKAYVILEANGKKKRFKVNKDLKFHFSKIKCESIVLYFEPKSYANPCFKYSFQGLNSLEVEIPYSPVCKYSKANKTCPKCHSDAFVIPIIYGDILLKNDLADKYFLGGCVTSGCDPNWYCKNDEIRF